MTRNKKWLLAGIASVCVAAATSINQHQENERLRESITLRDETVSHVTSRNHLLIRYYDAECARYDRLNEDYYLLQLRNDEQDREYDKECARYDNLSQDYGALIRINDQLHSDYESLEDHHDGLVAIHSQCETIFRACEETNASLWQRIFRLEHALEEERRD